ARLSSALRRVKRMAATRCNRTWRCNMKALIAQILVNCALLAALGGAESAYAQTREVFDEYGPPARAAPGYVDDSCQTGSYGPPFGVQRGDVIEDGEVVGRDPDPNIRPQLEREHSPGGYDEC